MSTLDEFIDGLPDASAPAASPNKSSLVQATAQTQDISPDEAAHVGGLAKKYNVPFLDATANKQALKQRDTFESDFYDELMAKSPKTAAFLQDPYRHAVSKDDIGGLAGIERFFQDVGTIKSGAAGRKNSPYSASLLNGKKQILSPDEYSALISQIASNNPAMTPDDVHAEAKRLADVVSGPLMRSGYGKGDLTEDALSYLGASGKSGLHSLAAASAKLLDEIQPFTTSDEDLAVIYKNDPEALRYYREESLATGLSRFARQQNQASEDVMGEALPSAQARYGNLTYATTDSEKSALASPVKVVSDAIRSLPSSLAMALTIFLTKGAATRVEAEALASGATAAEARKAGLDAAKTMAIKVGAASEGAMGYAQQANQTQNTIEGLDTEALAKSPMYQELINQGFDPYAAMVYTAHRTGEQSGVGAGLVDASVNALVGRSLGKLITEGGSLAARTGKGAGLEAFTEFWQSGGEQLSENLAVQQNVDPYKNLSDNVVESMIQGMAVGGLSGGVFSAAMINPSIAKQEGELNAAIAQAINEMSQARKVLGRDSETFQQFMDSVTEEGAQDFYIDADVLNQSGLAEQLAQDSPTVADQLQVALATNGTIRIPIAEYAAKIAPQEYAQQLVDHLKTEPDGYSKASAQEFYQSGAMEELESAVNEVIDSRKQATDFEASKEKVKQTVLDNLNTLGRFTPAKNELDATLIAARSAIRASQLGITPEQFFNDYFLRVVSKGGVGDQVLNQNYYRNNEFTFDPEKTNAKVIDSTSDEFKSKLREYLEDNASFFERKGYQTDAEGIDNLIEQASPTDIVDTAEFWDAPELANEFVQSLVEKGIDAVKTPDGIILLNPDLATKTDNEFNQSGMARRGSFDPSRNVISLLQGADLSTFIHESGHYFVETDVAIAANILEENSAFGPESMTAGQRQILQDVSALLSYAGIQGDIQTQVNTWYNLDFEEKRGYHEKLAESFERYIMEGKAPSIELMPVFYKFRQWMVSVYKSVKNFLSRNPDAGALSPEIRAVFDRMLATEEEIALAEKARSMAPMFASADEAGMTPEEFADYQRTGEQATADAVAELQTKGIRDMKWLRNAQSKALKKLQKQAAQQRAEVRSRVRAEVLQEPVYKAWQFLTGRMTEEDKLPAPEKPVAPSKLVVDPTSDSLFTAIAKMGGIRFDEAVSQWGIDPKDKIDPYFGKPVLHKSKGLSIDAMAERLGEEGYLRTDEDGKVDIAELEQRFMDEYRGAPQYSMFKDYSDQEQRKAGEGVDLTGLRSARLDENSLTDIGLPQEMIDRLVAQKMTAKTGALHPDIAADLLGEWESGGQLAEALATATPLQEEIERRTDERMTAEYAELSTPEAIQRAADMAIHNEARIKLVELEQQALAKAVNARADAGTDKNGRKRTIAVLPAAARQFAAELIGRQRIKDLRPEQYVAGETRAALAAEKAKDLVQKVAEKRNQLFNLYAAKAAYQAQEGVQRGIKYLRRFEKDDIRKRVDPGYVDQIEMLLDKYNLKPASKKALARQESLKEWLDGQREAGIEPDIPSYLVDQDGQSHYSNMTVEEFNGLIDAVRQLEHLGRLKNKLLTAKNQRDFKKVRDSILAAIDQNQKEKGVLNREPINKTERAISYRRAFMLAHIKASTLIRIMDNGEDAGPLAKALLYPAHKASDKEVNLNHEYSEKLHAIIDPVLSDTKLWEGLEGKGMPFKSLGISLNLMQRMVIALNMGNEGNIQRLLDGGMVGVVDKKGKRRSIRPEEITAVLETLTAKQLKAVQQIWDLYETFRPQVAEMERKLYGKEPDWVDPKPLTIKSADGETIELRGGYYPAKYDPYASSRSEEQDSSKDAKEELKAAFSAATVRRSFAKARAAEVHDRPLSLTMHGLFASFNETIHYLSWADWVQDAQKIMRDDQIKDAIREKHGHEALKQLKDWVNDVALGDHAMDDAVGRFLGQVRANVSLAGLTFNAMVGTLQLTGFANGAVRNGAEYQAMGIAKIASGPMELAKEVNGKSAYMEQRLNTLFQEMNEINNRIQGKVAISDFVGKHGFLLVQFMQGKVDLATWWGAYIKATAEGKGESDAVDIADQVVRDTQGSGLWHDLSAVQRNKYLRLLGVFGGYMNAMLNTMYTQAHIPASKLKKTADMMLLAVVVPAMTAILRNILVPSGGDDEPKDWLKKIAKEITGSAFGLFYGLRELQFLGNLWTGEPVDYSGPAGLRPIADVAVLATQAAQMEADMPFVKALVNVAGDLTGLPSAQINKTIKGVDAMNEGDTSSPLAPVFGYRKQ